MKMLAISEKEDRNIPLQEFELTKKEKIDLEHWHKKSRDAKESDRLKGILLRSEGWTVGMIAQALRIHESTITRHINDYREGKLTLTSGGSTSLLNEIQTQMLTTHLEIYTYQSTQEIIAHVQKEYRISYSVPGFNKWLHRHGFSYKKPKGYPHKASKNEPEKFISCYKKLKKNLGPNENILFMDSCHPSMSTKMSHGWIKKGHSKPIKTTASRTRINIIGAINMSKLTKPIVGFYSTVDS